MPRIGGSDSIWMNGLYDSLTIILVFPLVVYLGASGTIKGKFAGKVCKFLGDISYPIYITHYPIVYIYIGWISNSHLPIQETYPIALVTFVACVILAFASLKFYDEPVRKWLGKKF